MAIFGKANIIEAIRATRLVWWKIFEGPAQKNSGAFIATADFDNPNLGEKQSYDDLQAALNRLTAGRYILLAYKTPATKGGSAFESFIEVDSNGGSAVISGVNSGPDFILEGIGRVTAENFSESVDKLLSKKLADLQKEKDDQALRDRVKQLELELKENDGAFHRGVMAVGTVLYGQLSKTPQFREMVGVVADITKAANGAAPAAPAQHLAGTAAPVENQPALPANHVEGDTAEIGGIQVNQDELFSTLDQLGANNPDVLQHLKILAKLKTENPDMYTQAVQMAETL